METFEIVRRRLFQPLDEAVERARDETVRAFRKPYRDHRVDFSPEAREVACEDQMRRAWPLHPVRVTWTPSAPTGASWKLRVRKRVAVAGSTALTRRRTIRPTSKTGSVRGGGAGPRHGGTAGQRTAALELLIAGSILTR